MQPVRDRRARRQQTEAAQATADAATRQAVALERLADASSPDVADMRALLEAQQRQIAELTARLEAAGNGEPSPSSGDGSDMSDEYVYTLPDGTQTPGRAHLR
jgi:hypothetical protein